MSAQFGSRCPGAAHDSGLSLLEIALGEAAATLARAKVTTRGKQREHIERAIAEISAALKDES